MEPRDSINKKCSRCDRRSEVRIRSDLLCIACFESFAAAKFVKHMDGFKVRPPGIKPRKILLPLSFGPSSLVLLHLLNQRLSKQLQTVGRSGYELVVFHVIAAGSESRSRCLDMLQILENKYPNHQYYSSTLEAVHVYKYKSSRGGKASPSDNESRNDSVVESASPLMDVIDSFKSGSLKSELLDITQDRLILEAAKTLSCDAIARGDSTTRLAERTLTAISTGRGLFVPFQTADVLVGDGTTATFPLRDLMRHELVSFLQAVLPDLHALALRHGAFSEPEPPYRSTIPGLMHQYFESTEETYPSIVANVAKTAARLNVHCDAETKKGCSICATPMASTSDSGDESYEGESGSNLCYGCSKSFGSSIHSLSLAQVVPSLYGTEK